jgi:hypothetical protein
MIKVYNKNGVQITGSPAVSLTVTDTMGGSQMASSMTGTITVTVNPNTYMDRSLTFSFTYGTTSALVTGLIATKSGTMASQNFSVVLHP